MPRIRQIHRAARFHPSEPSSRAATRPQRPARRGRVPGAFNPVLLLLLLLLLVIAVAAPTAALAAPLTETEPNDTPLEANGPFGSDGFLGTINVSDDVDDVIFRLEGERQVTLTLAAEAGCGKFSTEVDLQVTDAAGNQITSAAVGVGGPLSATATRSWTTPRDATQYLAQISGADDAAVGCQTLLTISPGDALITGPLPAPSFVRALSVNTVGQVSQDAAAPVTATGSAAEEDEVAALWTTGGCPVTPDPNADGIVLGNPLATGPYTVTLATTSPSQAGTATLCTWLYDTLGVLQPLLRQQNVVVGPPPLPGPNPTTGPPANPTPSATKYPRVPATVSLGTKSLATGSTQINSLVVRQVPRSYAVRFSCTGAVCRSHIGGTFYAPPGSSTLSLTRSVRGMHLAPGAKLAIKVSRKDYQSHILSYTMRGGGLPPLRVSQCENPGATSAFAC